MKRAIYSLFLLLLFPFTYAQTISEIFVNIPEQQLPLLEKEWRLDLVDLYQSDKEARLQNMLGGFSVLEKLTDDYLLLRITERSRLEMKTFTLVNNTHVLCVVKTVEGPVPDSRIQFYNTNWEPLNREDLLNPIALTAFFKEDIDTESDDYRFALSRLDMEMIHYRLSPDAATVSVAFTTPAYLSLEERNRILPLLKEEPLLFTWANYRFN
ncbi:DUF3256 family protein [Parabacteroides sp. OttesenSCG-928-N08]|nr:DUF3256 family protein [Parabacteroides sp. OttesenSCG-928-N08]